MVQNSVVGAWPGVTRPAPLARFDDLISGTAWEFAAVERELVAFGSQDVPALLDEVERSAREGWWAVGYVAYEAASGLDPTLATRSGAGALPLAWFGLTTGPARVPTVDRLAGSSRGRASWSPEWDATRHRSAVGVVRDHIAAGQTYQVNLTTRLSAPAPGCPLGLYRDLAVAQRAAHHAYLDTGRFVIASASPELFFETRAGGAIGMRPMKGTAPRGRHRVEDEAAVARLRSSAKERAENVMIVDLVRNDLARVAVPGTVTVPHLLRPERFETVYQLTSDVTARLRDDVGLTDVFRALFPCGSVTGAPKARTMQIIREVEDGPRGAYCGAIGFVAPHGADVRTHFSVAIRTVVIDRDEDSASYGAGGGITWDSDPAAEYEELLSKARVLSRRPADFELIETMRHERAHGLHFLDAHLTRLAASADYFGFRFDQAGVRRALASKLDGAGDCRVRVRCERGGGVSVDIEPLPGTSEEPVGLVVDREPVDTSSCWPFHKTSRRAPYDARLARHPEADDVLLVNGAGEVTESCRANLAVRLDGVWYTPPVSCGCLPGIERTRLVDAGVLRERPIRVTDLRRAEALALVSSLRAWRAAVLVGQSTSRAAAAGWRRRASSTAAATRTASADARTS